MAEIRAYHAEDLDALYRVALATGAQGCDASPLYEDGKLVGHVYAAPYALYSPETAFVVADDHGVGGYIVGVANTPDFDAWLEAQWWPGLRALYPNPAGVPREQWSRDHHLCDLVHAPFRAPKALVEPFPAHLHINLMPHLRGQGAGRALMTRWFKAVRAAGAKGAHLSAGAGNVRAANFYRAMGFRALEFSAARFSGAVWFGIDLGSGRDFRPSRLR